MLARTLTLTLIVLRAADAVEVVATNAVAIVNIAVVEVVCIVAGAEARCRYRSGWQ